MTSKQRLNPKGKQTTQRKSDSLRAKTARRQRNQNLLLLGGAAIIVAIFAFVIYVNIRRQQPAGDEIILATQGNAHIDQDSVSPVAYNSAPPTSGPHYGNLASWGIHTQPVRYEQIIHNLEDGGVIIYYQCPDGCPDTVDKLAELVTQYERAERHVILQPNDPTWTVNNSQPLHQDMEARVALTAWQRIDKFDEFDEGRIRAFIERYEGIDHHTR